jgi:hypothetical protein
MRNTRKKRQATRPKCPNRPGVAAGAGDAETLITPPPPSGVYGSPYAGPLTWTQFHRLASRLAVLAVPASSPLAPYYSPDEISRHLDIQAALYTEISSSWETVAPTMPAVSPSRVYAFPSGLPVPPRAITKGLAARAACLAVRSEGRRNMDYLTTQEAADFLRLKKNTLEVWRIQGRGPAFLKLGSRVLYERATLETFAAANRKKSTSDLSAGETP